MIDFNYDVNLQTKPNTNFVIISRKTFVDVKKPPQINLSSCIDHFIYWNLQNRYCQIYSPINKLSIQQIIHPSYQERYV